MTIQIDNVTNEIDVVDAAANASITLMPKGTGAVNFAPGSSGLNLSNGNTVTAITRTASGSGYTSIPSVAITAPTTAGGVTATATTPIAINVATIANGGTGYTLNDVVTIVGGTFASTASRFTVSSVSGGVVTGLTASVADSYTVFPTQPASTTGGTGTGLTLSNLSGFVPSSGFTITNAGSGYVEQPTVTFSGGGGSGAAAFASVGSIGKINSLAGTTNAASLEFYSPISSSVPQLAIFNANIGHDTYPAVVSFSANAGIQARGSTNGNMNIGSNGSGAVRLVTNGTAFTEQLRVAHTASAVNYVQVTGAATGSVPVVSSQGSDTNIAIFLASKGNGAIRLSTNQTSNTQLRITHTANSVNFVDITGGAANAAVTVSASTASSDTNVDLNLTTKGTGAVNLNTGNGLVVKALDTGTTVANNLFFYSAAAGASPTIITAGSDANVSLRIASKGTGSLTFRTDGFSTNTEQFRVAHTASAVNYVQVTGNSTTNAPIISTQGSDTNIGFALSTKGTGRFDFFTNNVSQLQFRVEHTASAVNYVQVTGGATGVQPIISSQGSDSNIALTLRSKGTFACEFGSSAGTVLFQAVPVASSVNFLRASPAAAGSGPGLSAQGSDTNIDLTLTPKGTGYVQFGTHTATALTISGYIEIKDSAGNVRKLAVVT